MKVPLTNTRNDFLHRVEKAIDSLKDGKGLTKIELAEQFGFSSSSTVDKWCRRHPALNKRKVFIPAKNRQQRILVFVNPRYRRKLLSMVPPVAYENY